MKTFWLKMEITMIRRRMCSLVYRFVSAYVSLFYFLWIDTWHITLDTNPLWLSDISWLKMSKLSGKRRELCNLIDLWNFRTFVPFVVVDNCISILFVLSMFFFEVDFNINLKVCRNLPGYTITFTIFRTVSFQSDVRFRRKWVMFSIIWEEKVWKHNLSIDNYDVSKNE